jgi:hypothetical protein
LGFLLVAETVILEFKAVPALLPVHEAQLLTYLCMSDLPVGPRCTSSGPERFVASRAATAALRADHVSRSSAPFDFALFR